MLCHNKAFFTFPSKLRIPMDYSILKNFKNFGKKVSVRPILMTATFATEKERVLLFGHRKADTRKVSGEKNSGFSFFEKTLVELALPY